MNGKTASMSWEVLLDDDFASWLTLLDAGVQAEILAHAGLLRDFGPQLGRPQVDHVKASTFDNMKEMRVQYRGDPWRILFAFDPERKAVPLVGGCKAGDKRWYKTNVPIADERFRRHLERLKNKKP